MEESVKSKHGMVKEVAVVAHKMAFCIQPSVFASSETSPATPEKPMWLTMLLKHGLTMVSLDRLNGSDSETTPRSAVTAKPLHDGR